MAITGPASYLPTTDLFIAHWTSANAALGVAGPISLAANATVATLTTLRGTLATQRAAVEAARNAVEGTRADIELLKAAMLGRMAQFRGKLESLVPGSRWVAMLPKAFTVSEGMGLVIPPLDKMEDLWRTYEADVDEILLMGGYTLAGFQADLTLLKGHYTAHHQATNALGLARGKRNETQDTIYDVLKQYRQRIPSEFAGESAISETLPRLSPLPGSTPDAVELSGSYDPATTQAVLAWTAPTDESVATLEVRGSVGPEYDDEDDVLLATIPATGPHTWTGPFGLGAPGTAAAFKLYSITEEGNEKGSNAVTVERPV
ncbi:MAG: hypothetical protein V4584_15660 [Verrucomicrobiota bacterium]